MTTVAPAGRRVAATPEEPARRTAAWHALDVRSTLAALDTDATQGLTTAEAERRLRLVGPNVFGTAPDTPLWRLALRQFESLVVLLLLAAAVVAALLGETPEALAILAALVLNAAIGCATEWRARTSLARLRALGVRTALVWRDGRVQRIAADGLVPGDVIVLDAGAHVPADARLVRSVALRVTEAALTGESESVDKDADAAIDGDAPLAERRTMTYLGTTTVAGTGVAVVTATGDATELGKIGHLVGGVPERTTPLERQVEGLGRRLIVAALGACAVVAVAGMLHGQPWGLMLETAITLAVSAIPEGLPAIVTVALAMGVWRLARAGALVRRLPAVETLGCTTVICADKTGTMTENRMTVTRIVLRGRTLAVSGGGEAFAEDGRRLEARAAPGLIELLTVCALANDARIEPHDGGVRLHGDPTETALLTVALGAGIGAEALAHDWTRLVEIPFSPETRFMATLCRSGTGERTWMVKGAPGAVLDRCVAWSSAAGVVPLTADEREHLLDENRRLARLGFRVLAAAWQHARDEADAPRRLVFLGLVALQDPVRPGVREAIERCRAAGIRTIMLTGDQRSTAEAVGARLGLAPDDIRSRVSPEEKLALIEALQASGEVVAMTGDGVNDAPALARADIGVAMGRHGTDVAREAADLVLTDDNFATIVRAVEEGRIIYGNLRKVIHFLFSCNLSEIATVFVAIVAGFPAPLLPLQILWVNLVTDILPAMALVRDPAEPGTMRRRPRDPHEALVTWRFGARMLGEGALLAAGVLSAYFWTIAADGAGARPNTVAFLALVLIHPLQALRCRSEHASWWRLPPNRLAWAALAALVVAQWWAISWAPLRGLLGTVSLSAADWLVAAVAVTWPVLLLEITKAFGRSVR